MKNRRTLPVKEQEQNKPRSLKIHCPAFNHIKNTIVCSLCCSLRDRCKEFQQFYAINREAQDDVVNDYILSHSRLPSDSLLIIQYSLVVLRKMNDTYIWIDKDDRAEVLTLEQVLLAAEEGRKPKYIFLAKQELALRYQLVPKSRREESPVKAASPLKVEVPKNDSKSDSLDTEDKRKKRQGKAVA
jgi:hypothetical protein